MAVSLIKLKNGTEIIGELQKAGIDSCVVLENPLQINYKHVDYSSQPIISFSKYCPLSNETLFKFDMTHDVMHVTTVRKHLELYYNVAMRDREMIEKALDTELQNVISEHEQDDTHPSESKMIDFLTRVKIDGYPN